MVKKSNPSHTYWPATASGACLNCGTPDAKHDSLPRAVGIDAATERRALASFVVDGVLYFVLPHLVAGHWTYHVATATGSVLDPHHPIDTAAGIADLDAFVGRVRANVPARTVRVCWCGGENGEHNDEAHAQTIGA